MKIIHIITDLDTGGAEIMLYKLLKSLQDETIESAVISLMGRGKITKQIEALGIKVETLDLEQGKRPSWKTIKKLRQFMLTFNPDIVQGWMYHGNIAATVAVFLFKPMHRKVKLFWNVRQTLYDIKKEKQQTKWVIYLSRWLSVFSTSVIYNSTVSMQQHNNIGFSKRKRCMIPNGFDLQKFYPDQGRSQQLRKDLGVSKNEIIVGHISRFHPMKDHATLLRTINHVMKNIYASNGKQEVIFLLIGHEVTSALSTNPAIHFLGERTDIPNIMSALDILVSSSAWGEGFPNVIGEAMASEVPCVVTDVGDSAYIVGNYGMVCPVGDDKCIADSMMQLIENRQQRKIMGQQARQRIKQNYSMDKIKKEYLQVWGF
ncbi:MAG: glycosyltransferase [Candidatus Ruthia sp.]|jgi:glycosyltransferase involved in cell wall biosynthesis|nr:glycosyltransferase [Candidatus Ruthturnera sp.]